MLSLLCIIIIISWIITWLCIIIISVLYYHVILSDVQYHRCSDCDVSCPKYLLNRNEIESIKIIVHIQNMMIAWWFSFHEFHVLPLNLHYVLILRRIRRQGKCFIGSDLEGGICPLARYEKEEKQMSTQWSFRVDWLPTVGQPEIIFTILLGGDIPSELNWSWVS